MIDSMKRRNSSQFRNAQEFDISGKLQFPLRLTKVNRKYEIDRLKN